MTVGEKRRLQTRAQVRLDGAERMISLLVGEEDEAARRSWSGRAFRAILEERTYPRSSTKLIGDLEAQEARL
jgi:hypothetical protein